MTEKDNDIIISLETDIESVYEVNYQPLGIDSYGDVTITFDGEPIDLDTIIVEPIKYDLLYDGSQDYNITINYKD